MNCLAPIHLRNESKTGKVWLTVPCGKCEACVNRKKSEWFIRLKYHQKFSDFACFVTLTYDDEHLPQGCNVSKVDVQLYHKRLRQMLGKEKSKCFQYYLTSEYGPETLRPHYHAIYFGISPQNYQFIEKAWQNGFVQIKEINDNRIRYVCGYIIEKYFVPYGREPLFNLISKGLGKEYIDKIGKSFNGNDISRMYVPLYDGKYVMPRYYKEKLYSPSKRLEYANQVQKKYDRIEQQRIESMGEAAYFRTNFFERNSYIEKVRSVHKKKKQI